MSRIDPPPPKPQSADVDALLRAFVEQPVPALAPGDARQMRERVTQRLEGQLGARPPAPSPRWHPWAIFAAAACLPIAIWATASLLHDTSPRRADVALVTALAGPTTIAQGSVERAIERSADAPLGPGDELRTGQDAAARASLPTGAIVDIGPWARVRFSAAGPGAALRDRLELVAGRVQVRVPKLRPGDEVRVQTADATVVVHGTKFSVERLAAQGARAAGTHVSVTEGVVTVDTVRGQHTLTASMELVTPEEPVTGIAEPPPAPTVADAPVADAPPSLQSGSPRSTLAAENALLSEAAKARREGQDDRALALLDVFVARHPGSPLMETARVERLRILEATGATERLGREAERYLADYPRGYARDEANRMLAATRAPSP